MVKTRVSVRIQDRVMAILRVIIASQGVGQSQGFNCLKIRVRGILMLSYCTEFKTVLNFLSDFCFIS